MKVVLDTNILMSGIFFAGVPGEILSAWRQGRFELVLSPDVMAEYERVAGELSEDYGGIEADAMLALIVSKSAMMDAPPLSRQICEDPDDDIFIACAVAGGAIVIVSGDKLLLKVSAYQGVRVMTARQFVEEFIR